MTQRYGSLKAKLTDPADRSNFERLAGEPAAAYHAFTHYRDLGPGVRSLDRGWHEHHRVCRGQAQPAWRRRPMNHGDWSARWSWVSRARAYDEHMEAQRRAAFQAEQVEAGRRQAQILAAAMTALAAPLRVALAVATKPEDIERLIAAAGATALGTRLALADARQAAALLPGVISAERTVLGLAVERGASPSPDEPPVIDPVAQAITASPELTALAEKLLDAAAPGGALPPGPGAEIGEVGDAEGVAERLDAEIGGAEIGPEIAAEIARIEVVPESEPARVPPRVERLEYWPHWGARRGDEDDD
jgi:hypothetical protein